MLLLELGLVQWDQIAPRLTIIPTGFASHLLIDSFTDEGIFLFPNSSRISDWLQRRPDLDNTWIFWNKFSFGAKRSSNDPILNLCVSLMSLVVLLVLLALTPL